MSATGSVSILNVTQQFGGLVALEGVSIEIPAGRIHGVIGPNGAGKTTLLNVLSGLQRPTSGTISIGGQDVTRWPGHKMVAKAGLVRTFQTVRLFESMSVRENVIVAGQRVTSVQKAKDETERILDRLGLTSVADKPATSLAYGLQRRVELARVMVANPKVVLLDEPAAGLNPQERKALAEFLRALRNDGVTIVLVEHHMDLVHAVCESCTVLNFGKVIATGTPDEVTQDSAVLEAYLGGRHHRATDVAAPLPGDGEDPE